MIIEIKNLVWFGISLDEWAWLIGGTLTLLTFIKGILEYVKSNRLKRTEFLEKLVLEFDDPKMKMARKILDDFSFESEGEEGWSDDRLIKEGDNSNISDETIADNFKRLLRNHKVIGVYGHGEIRARESFDYLLDFFSKLEYFLNLDLISKEELRFFQYYIERCAFKADGAVMQYAVTYGFPSLFRLIYVLNIKPVNQDLFKLHLNFNSDKQKQRYSFIRFKK